MCPSFMVTHEEKHTTRGRARHLWEMLNGNVIENGWRDENVKETLDLCLACKGCKGDCPVNVDMATYKAEFLSHYWEGRVRPRYAYTFGFVDKWARVAAIAPGFANLVTQLPVLRTIAKKIAGMPMQREIPQFAPETFKHWFRRHSAQNPHGPKVILWADTFNNNFSRKRHRQRSRCWNTLGSGYMYRPGIFAADVRCTITAFLTKPNAIWKKCWIRSPKTLMPARRLLCLSQVVARYFATS